MKRETIDLGHFTAEDVNEFPAATMWYQTSMSHANILFSWTMTYGGKTYRYRMKYTHGDCMVSREVVLDAE